MPAPLTVMPTKMRLVDERPVTLAESRVVVPVAVLVPAEIVANPSTLVVGPNNRKL